MACVRFWRLELAGKGMALEHEYSLVGGYNRSHVGRWLGRLAAAISAGLVFVLLAVVDLARLLKIDVNLPPMVLSLVGAGAVYAGLYWLFDRAIWKLGPVSRILKAPNLAGTWRVSGLRMEQQPPQPWSGQITIVQSWDKLRVHLDTQTSCSDSVAAALLHDAAAGYRLMYHYKNQPRMGAAGLAAHHGFAELTFAPDGQTATGEYFNGRGRNTYGTMSLIKETR